MTNFKDKIHSEYVFFLTEEKLSYKSITKKTEKFPNVWQLSNPPVNNPWVEGEISVKIR